MRPKRSTCKFNTDFDFIHTRGSFCSSVVVVEDSRVARTSVHNHIYNTTVIIHVKHIHETAVSEMVGQRNVRACTILHGGVSPTLDWLAG